VREPFSWGSRCERRGAAGAAWFSISPNEAGFTSDLETRLDEAITENRVWNLHGIVIVRQRRLVLERYFEDDDEIRQYGYHWYLGKFAFTVSTGPRWDRSRLERFWNAIGNGGQRLFVFPGLDLAVAITAGNYDTSDQWVPATRVIREVVLPSIF
jgi:hypothetical protein